MRYHHTTFRKVVNNKDNNNKTMLSIGENLEQLEFSSMTMQNGIATLKNSPAVSFIVKHALTRNKTYISTCIYLLPKLESQMFF